METYYLVDFENDGNNRIRNIPSLSGDNHVYIFYTPKTKKINIDSVSNNDIDIKVHKVAEGEQSLDKHLLSYLGYLLGKNEGKECSFVIISGDIGYDKPIEFWKEKGFENISRKECIPELKGTSNIKESTENNSNTSNTTNIKISKGVAGDLSGEDRCDLNMFVQHKLKTHGYSSSTCNRICKYVIAHCNDERILNGIHNDLKKEYPEQFVKIYDDVKKIINEFFNSQSPKVKKEAQIRSVYGQHFKKKKYVENKEATISILLNSKTKQTINTELLKLYRNNEQVSEIIKRYQPLIKELPSK